MRKHATIMLWAVLVTGCNNRGTAIPQAAITAASMTNAECGACSMVVAEQPAPRAQLVHRDSTRKFFCSLSCMAHYLAAPSPHGEAKAILVEQYDPQADPKQTDRKACPWIPAKAASYVVGIERPGVMGTPALSFQHRAEAETFARQHKGRVVDFAGMRIALRAPR